MSDTAVSELRDILVCPVDRTALSCRDDLICEHGHHYRLIGATPSLVPSPLPSALASRQATWQALQDNGNVAYRLAPKLNLEGNAEIFGEFAQLEGCVLDIGCGPGRERPVYARSAGITRYVGIDPLLGEQPRAFCFVHAIGEALPCRDQQFEHVLLAGSLDHMLDFKMALHEASRVARQNGKLHLKIERGGNAAQASPLSRLAHLIRRGLGQFASGVRHIGLIPAIRYCLAIMRLRIPPGAVDYFHVYFPTENELTACLRDLNWRVERRQETPVDIQLTFVRMPAPRIT